MNDPVQPRAAPTPLIMFLDDDDVWLPWKLELQVPVLEAHPDIGVVYSQFRRLAECASWRILCHLMAQSRGVTGSSRR